MGYHPLRRTTVYGRVLVLVAALATAAFAAPPTAEAAVSRPSLQGTYPASPGTSLTPRLYGNYGSVFTSVLRPQALGLLVPPVGLSGVGAEEAQITVFGEAECGGVAVGTGTVAELSGSGIKVSVAAKSTTSFSAIAEVEGETSACSGAIAYRQVEDPPEQPTFSETVPASPAGDTSPRLRGVAPAESIVTVYATSDCSGSPVATGTAALFEGEGIAVSVAAGSTITFHARSGWAGLYSGCSASSLSYTAEAVAGGSSEESSGAEVAGSGTSASATAVSVGRAPTAPSVPHLRLLPSGRSNDLTPLVVGGAHDADLIQIFVNGGCAGQPAKSVSPAEFSAGVPISVPSNSESAITARALNESGSSSCSETVRYVEDSTPPHTRITFGPGVKVRARAVVFRFADVSDDPPGTTFRCKLDWRRWRPCGSPFRIAGLKPRVHVFKVQAIDAAGNREAGARHRRFKVVRR